MATQLFSTWSALGLTGEVSVAGQYFFSERLHQALREAGYAPDSPAQLAREFNRHFADDSITVDEARAWLVGAVVPDKEKLHALAAWLSMPAERAEREA